MVGLLWTSDQPVVLTSTYTGQHNRQTSMPRAGFEPTIYTTIWCLQLIWRRFFSTLDSIAGLHNSAVGGVPHVKRINNFGLQSGLSNQGVMGGGGVRRVVFSVRMLKNEVLEALLHSKTIQLALKCIVFSFTFYLKQRKRSKNSNLLLNFTHELQEILGRAARDRRALCCAGLLYSFEWKGDMWMMNC
jgi:hypothetical protein